MVSLRTNRASLLWFQAVPVRYFSQLVTPAPTLFPTRFIVPFVCTPRRFCTVLLTFTSSHSVSSCRLDTWRLSLPFSFKELSSHHDCPECDFPRFILHRSHPLVSSHSIADSFGDFAVCFNVFVCHLAIFRNSVFDQIGASAQNSNSDLTIISHKLVFVWNDQWPTHSSCQSRPCPMCSFFNLPCHSHKHLQLVRVLLFPSRMTPFLRTPPAASHGGR